MSDWQPISTAPRDGTDVLLFVPQYQQSVRIGSYDVSEHFRNGKLNYQSEGWSLGRAKPTHWMPLPEVPGAGSSKLPRRSRP